MTILSSPHRYDSSGIEAVISHVDPKRFVASARTIDGRILTDVRWLMPTGGQSRSGMHFTPNIGDKVFILTSLGYPLILGCIPTIGVPSEDVDSIVDTTTATDAGSASNIRNGMVANPEKPSDFLPGDIVYTTKGGGLLALLDSGGIVLRSSRLSQLVMSKLNGLFRIVSSNYQRYSDASAEVSANIKGRLYSWYGHDKSITRNINGTQRYQEVYGDVVAGELKKGTPSHTGTIPASDTRVVKQWLENDGGSPVMIKTIYDNGKVTLVINNGGTLTESSDGAEWKTEVTNGTTSFISITPTGIEVNHANKSKAIFNTSSVELNYNNDSKVILSGSAVSIDFMNTSKALFDMAGAQVEYNNSKMKLNLSEGSIDYNGVSKVVVDAASARLTNGAHMCSVGPAGVVLG